jgi:hypothetical protein
MASLLSFIRFWLTHKPAMLCTVQQMMVMQMYGYALSHMLGTK